MTSWARSAIVSDEAELLDFMVDFLEKRPIDAEAYGLAKDELTRKRVARIIPHIVVIGIVITPVE